MRQGDLQRRELAAWIQQDIHLDLHSARFPKDDATLVPAAGPCTTCPKRTGNAPALFPDFQKGDTCTDPSCFTAKQDAHTRRRLAELGVRASRPPWPRSPRTLAGWTACRGPRCWRCGRRPRGSRAGSRWP